MIDRKELLGALPRTMKEGIVYARSGATECIDTGIGARSRRGYARNSQDGWGASAYPLVDRQSGQVHRHQCLEK